MGKGLFHSLFEKKNEKHDEKRIPKQYQEASVSAGDFSSDEIHVLSGEDFQKNLQKGIKSRLVLLYSSGSEEEGSYEYTFRAENSFSDEERKELKRIISGKPGAIRLIFLSDNTFKILYIPA